MASNLSAVEGKVERLQNDVHWIRKQVSKNSVSAMKDMTREFQKLQRSAKEQLVKDMVEMRKRIAISDLTKENVRKNETRIELLSRSAAEQANFVLDLSGKYASLKNSDIVQIGASLKVLENQIRELRERKIGYILDLMKEIATKGEKNRELTKSRDEDITKIKETLDSMQGESEGWKDLKSKVDEDLSKVDGQVRKTVSELNQEFEKGLRVDFMNELRFAEKLKMKVDGQLGVLERQIAEIQGKLEKSIDHRISMQVEDKIEKMNRKMIAKIEESQRHMMKKMEERLQIMIVKKMSECEKMMLKKSLNSRSDI